MKQSKTLNAFIKEIEESLEKSKQVGLLSRLVSKRTEMEAIEEYILKKLKQIKKEIKIK